MKERYNRNPYILSEKDIEEYLSTCLNRDHGLSLMLRDLASQGQHAKDVMDIHNINYSKIKDICVKEHRPIS